VAPIRTLESGVSSVIAAGEVVERPASVVKELVENALDAGATRVAIDLVDGGKASIRVDDDGAGIPAAELPLAAENFSTSKIREIDDLSRVETLGFRGEALASIRAVSVLAARSRARSEEIGRELRFRGAERTGDGPCVRTPGTEIVVERLFFNLPARRKFLRSGASELRRIVGIVQAYALAFPAVSFLLRDAGREVLSYPVSRLDDRVEIVLGSELSGRMAKVEHEEGALRVSGYASKPDFTRSNRSLQYFFVNRRFVKDRLLSHAVSQAYESLIPRNSYPALVLFVSIPPGGIDVNVHPAKAEVRFRDEAELHRVVRSAIRGAIGAARAGFAEAVEAAYGAIFPEGGSGAADAAAAIPRELFIAFGDEGGGSLETAGGSALREAPVSLFGAERPSAALSTGGLYWQLHQSFILIQIRGGLVIIDQHAAHERVLFDRARASLPGTRALSQSLLFPAAITLSPDEFERYESLGRTLDSLGFETEPFGPRSLIVRGIPAGVRNWNDGRLLQEILGEGRSGVDGFLRSYACRAAIKAGTRLSAEEMESLADQLFATELPYTCPHGRPTMLRVGLAELERRFARSVSPERT
jgi:DNA mismatch repair protein MutL